VHSKSNEDDDYGEEEEKKHSSDDLETRVAEQIDSNATYENIEKFLESY
jgi:hypothetical protein